MKAKVSIVGVTESVCEAVAQVMELAEWRNYIQEGADVCLKPNLGWDLFLPGAVTSPWVVEGVILTIQEHVRQIYLVEADQVLVNVERALRQTNMDLLCEKYDVKWVNLSKESFTKVHLDKGLILEEIEVPEILLRTQLITIPVIKTHDKTTITGAIKNQWGCLDKLRHEYHLVLDEALVDINSVVKPRFAVLDATVGLEGDGPKSGRPKIVDLVLASGDIVALDTVQAKIMGFDPQEIGHIRNCSAQGLGVCELSDIEIIGEKLMPLNFHFLPSKHNLVSVVELSLRRSTLRRIAFDTPLFNIFRWGALVWYFIWYYVLKGRQLRDEILRNPKYGPQWDSRLPSMHKRA